MFAVSVHTTNRRPLRHSAFCRDLRVVQPSTWTLTGHGGLRTTSRTSRTNSATVSSPTAVEIRHQRQDQPPRRQLILRRI